jgi:uncharacterized protein YndB with AHSA1/START domain
LDVQLFSCVFNLAHTVSRSVLLDAPPEQVWAALVDPEALSEWLADGVELVEEAERLAFQWRREGGGPSRVELILDPVAGGTEVTVIESGLRLPAPMLAAAWARSLGRLRLAVGRLVLA